MSSRRLLLILLIAAGLTPAPAPIIGEEPPVSVVETSAPSTVATPPAAAGWRVYVDPVTGEILDQPLPGQAEALSRRLLLETPDLAFSSDGLVPFPLRGGGVGVNLQGRFMTSTVIRLHPDGSSSISCVDAEQAATGELAPPASDTSGRLPVAER